MLPALHDLVAPEHLAALRRPIEEARGLPSSVYTDPDVFALERERLFRRHWVGAGFAHEIPGPGDALPVEVGGIPIILVRDHRSSVRAFVNVCRHRASTILQAPARGLRNFRCPFHSWTYELDGRLKIAPYWDGSLKGAQLDAGEHSLVPVRCELWENLVFVNLSETGPPLAATLAPLVARWSRFGLAELVPVHIAEAVIPANWKVVIEGFLELYHEPWVHEDIAMRLDGGGERTWEYVMEGELMGFADRPPSVGDDHPDIALPRVPGMPTTGPAPTEIHLLFPTTSVNLLDNHFVQTVWSPISPVETRWRSAWYFAADPEQHPEQAAPQRAIIDFWKKVRGEDLRVVLSTQRGHEAAVGTPIRFSPFWEPILLHFQRHLVDRLSG